MISKLLHKIFGDQSERAVRPLWQRLEKEINPISAQITEISNDELRGRINAIRDRIRGGAQEYKDQMAAVRAEIETLDYDKREPLWKKIDDLREGMFDNYAKELDAALFSRLSRRRHAVSRRMTPSRLQPLRQTGSLPQPARTS